MVDGAGDTVSFISCKSRYFRVYNDGMGPDKDTGIILIKKRGFHWRSPQKDAYSLSQAPRRPILQQRDSLRAFHGLPFPMKQRTYYPYTYDFDLIRCGHFCAEHSGDWIEH